ncbi:TOM1-like protein 2 [Rutidosis leptorrhynchoides]|uniref:TOM1-like protein 2 n=1 Tax=Rutidosis leptorrhynchoides TaxID=125765 RepID=UPI003A999B75
MDKLDKFKLASSSFGERLMTNSVQMSRIVSTKMKEMLQSPSPESKIVDEATLQTLEEPNWGLNLRICAMINNDQFNGTEIVKAIKKKIGVNNNKNIVGQRLSLDLLETCCSNCDKVFSEVASEKVLDDMVEMINDVRTDDRNRMKAVRLIRAWGESDELMYLPVFRQTHLNLKAKGIPNTRHTGNSSPMHQTTESMVYEQPMTTSDRYPLPDLDLLGIEDDASTYTYVRQSVEQKKELLLVGRNSVDLLSSIIDSGMDPIPINDELTVSILDKCKESLPVVQRIAETTTDDDVLLFEALNLHDELEQIISRCEEIKGILGSYPLKDDNKKPAETVPSPVNAEEIVTTSELKVKEESQTGPSNKYESIEKEQTR